MRVNWKVPWPNYGSKKSYVPEPTENGHLKCIRGSVPGVDVNSVAKSFANLPSITRITTMTTTRRMAATGSCCVSIVMTTSTQNIQRKRRLVKRHQAVDKNHPPPTSHLPISTNGCRKSKLRLAFLYSAGKPLQAWRTAPWPS